MATSYNTKYSRMNRPEGTGEIFNVRTVPRYDSEDYKFLEELGVSIVGSVNLGKLTPSLVSGILASADTGFAQEQAILIKSIIDKDNVIASHLQTRKLSVLGLGWSLIGGENEKREKLNNIFDKAGIDNLILYLMEAIAFGYSGAKQIWLPGGELKGWTFIPPENFEFDLAGNPAVYIGGTPKGLNTEHKYKYVFHSPVIKSGIPPQRSILRPLIWAYLFKNYAIKYKTRFLEKFGIPFIIEKISDQDFMDAERRAALKKELQELGANGIGIATKESELTFLNPTGSGNNANFVEWINKLDEYFALTILGQIASSAEATGMSNGQIQENVRKDILKADAMSISETINNQVLKPLEYYLFGTQECKFQIDSEPANMKVKLETLKGLVDAGYQVEDEYVEETWGMPLKKKKAGQQPTQQIPVSSGEIEQQPANPAEQQATQALQSAMGMSDLKAFADANFNQKLQELIVEDNAPAQISNRVKSANSLTQLKNVLAQEIGKQEVDSENALDKNSIDKLKNLVAEMEMWNIAQQNKQQNEIEESRKKKVSTPQEQQTPQDITTSEAILPKEESLKTKLPQDERREEVAKDLFNAYQKEAGTLETYSQDDIDKKFNTIIKDLEDKYKQEDTPEKIKDLYTIAYATKPAFTQITATKEEDVISRIKNLLHLKANTMSPDASVDEREMTFRNIFDDYRNMLEDRGNIAGIKYLESKRDELRQFFNNIVDRIDKEDYTIEYNKEEQKQRSKLEKAEEAINRGAEDLIKSFANAGDMLGYMFTGEHSKEFSKYLRNLSKYKNIEDIKDAVDKDSSIIGKGIYGFLRMTPMLLGSAATGIATGGLGTTAYWALQGAGDTYDQLKSEGIKDDIAIPVSLVTGTINGLIEQSQAGRAFKNPLAKKEFVRNLTDKLADAIEESGIKVLHKTLAKRVGGKTADRLMKKLADKGVTKALSETAKFIGEEGLEEVAQDFVSNVGSDVSKFLNDEIYDTNKFDWGKSAISPEQLQHSLMQGVNAIPTLLVMGAVGKGKKLAIDKTDLSTRLALGYANAQRKEKGLPELTFEEFKSDIMSKQFTDNIIDAVNEYKKQTKGAKGLEIEFIDDPEFDEVAYTDMNTGKVVINLNELKGIENDEKLKDTIQRLLMHEDIGHRILFGKNKLNNVLTEDELNKLFKAKERIKEVAGFNKNVEEAYRNTLKLDRLRNLYTDEYEKFRSNLEKEPSIEEMTINDESQKFFKQLRQDGYLTPELEKQIDKEIERLIDIETITNFLESDEFQDTLEEGWIGRIIGKIINKIKSFFKSKAGIDVDIDFETAKQILRKKFRQYRDEQFRDANVRIPEGEKEKQLAKQAESELLSETPVEKMYSFGNVALAGVEKGNKEEIQDAIKEWKEKGTDSKYFKKWNNNAPIVDAEDYTQFETGKPFVTKVYHGVAVGELEDNEFKPEFLGKSTNAAAAKHGFFFTSNKDNALNYILGEKITSHLPNISSIPYSQFKSQIKKINDYIKGNIEYGQLPFDLREYISKHVITKDWLKENLLYGVNFDKLKNKEIIYGNIDKLKQFILDSNYDKNELINYIRAWNEYHNPSQNVIQEIYNVLSKKFTTKEQLQDNERLRKNVISKIYKDIYDDYLKRHPVKYKRLVKNLQGSLYPLYITLQNPYIYDIKGESYSPSVFKQIVKEAKEKGHDGVVITRTYDPEHGNVFVVFPEYRDQIKSVENRGTFGQVLEEGESPYNIMYSLNKEKINENAKYQKQIKELLNKGKHLGVVDIRERFKRAMKIIRQSGLPRSEQGRLIVRLRDAVVRSRSKEKALQKFEDIVNEISSKYFRDNAVKRLKNTYNKVLKKQFDKLTEKERVLVTPFASSLENIFNTKVQGSRELENLRDEIPARIENKGLQDAVKRLHRIIVNRQNPDIDKKIEVMNTILDNAEKIDDEYVSREDIGKFAEGFEQESRDMINEQLPKVDIDTSSNKIQGTAKLGLYLSDALQSLGQELSVVQNEAERFEKQLKRLDMESVATTEYDDPKFFYQELEDELKDTLQSIEGKSFNELTPYEIDRLTSAIKALKQIVSKRRNIILDGKEVEKDKAILAMQDDIKVMGEQKYREDYPGAEALEPSLRGFTGQLKKVFFLVQSTLKTKAHYLDGANKEGIMTKLLFNNLNISENKAIGKKDQLEGLLHDRIKKAGIKDIGAAMAIASPSVRRLLPFKGMLYNVDKQYREYKHKLNKNRRVDLDIPGFGKAQMTLSQLMTFYATAKTPEGIRYYIENDIPRSEMPDNLRFLTAKKGWAFMDDNGDLVQYNKALTLEQVEYIYNKMFEFEDHRKIADVIHDLFQKELRDTIWQKHEEEFGYPPPSINAVWYFTQQRIREESMHNAKTADNMDEWLESEYGHKTLTSFSAIQRRVNNENPAFIDDIFGVTSKHIKFAANFYGYLTEINAAKRFLADKQVKKIISSYYSTDMYQSLIYDIARIESKNANVSKDPLSGSFQKLVRRLAVVYLGANFFGSIPKQIASYYTSIGDTATSTVDYMTKYTKAVPQIFSRFMINLWSPSKDMVFNKVEQKIIDFVDEYSPQIKERRRGGYANRTLQAMSQIEDFYKTLSDKKTIPINISEFWMYGVRRMDSATMTQIAIDGFNKALQVTGISQDKFIKNQLTTEERNRLGETANKIIIDTYTNGQPMMAAKDTPAIIDSKYLGTTAMFSGVWYQQKNFLMKEATDAVAATKRNGLASTKSTNAIIKMLLHTMTAATGMALVVEFLKQMGRYLTRRNEDQKDLEEFRKYHSGLIGYMRAIADSGELTRDLIAESASYPLQTDIFMRIARMNEIIKSLTKKISKGEDIGVKDIGSAFWTDSIPEQLSMGLIYTLFWGYKAARAHTAGDISDKELAQWNAKMLRYGLAFNGVLTNIPLMPLKRDWEIITGHRIGKKVHEPIIIREDEQAQLEETKDMLKRMEEDAIVDSPELAKIIRKIRDNLDKQGIDTKDNEEGKLAKTSLFDILIALADDMGEVTEEDLNNVNVENIELKKQVNDLIKLKKKLDEVKTLFKAKSRELLPKVKEPVVTRQGTVFSVDGAVSKIADRKRLIRVLIEKLHVSPNTAKIIVEQGTIPKYIDAYLKVLPGKTELKTVIQKNQKA